MMMDLDVHLKAIIDRDIRASCPSLAGVEPCIRNRLRSFAPVIRMASARDKPWP
jgi:hypothetical protein